MLYILNGTWTIYLFYGVPDLYVFISLVHCIAGVMSMTAVSFSWDGAQGIRDHGYAETTSCRVGYHGCSVFV